MISEKNFTSLRSKGYLHAKLIGQGAHADVFRVWDAREGIFYACKVSREKKLWSCESNFLRRIKHPLFPAYHESWQEGKYCFLIMEYVPGENLNILLERRGRLSQRQAVRTAGKLAEGLAYLEELPEPVLFRDLKAENIRVREDGMVKLLDFGCACLAEEEESSLAGTPGYAAPEQLDSPGRVGTYSDVYAFGRLLHFMLTGDNPCLPPSRKPPIRAYDRKFSFGLERLVEECVREEAEERLPDMRRVLYRLGEVVEEYSYEDICFCEDTARFSFERKRVFGRHRISVGKGRRRRKLFALWTRKRLPEFMYEKNIYKSSTIS